MGPREIAFQALLEIYGGRYPKGALWQTHGELFSTLSPRDRSLAIRIIKGVLEEDHILTQLLRSLTKEKATRLDKRVELLLKIGLYQIHFLQKIPPHAAVDETVAIGKKRISQRACGFVNWCLREAIRLKEAGSLHIEAEKTGPKAYPRWLISHLERVLGKQDTMAYLREEGLKDYLALRTNPMKISRDELQGILSHLGIWWEKGRLTPHAVIIKRKDLGLIKAPVLEKGLAQVQSEASQLAVLLLSPKPGECILDLCSGLGTKALYMAQLMENRGVIYCVDKDYKRLKVLLKESQRLGIKIIKPLVLDITKELTSIKINFSKILLDAPCSNLGALHRKPELKLHMHPKRIDALSKLQLEMLSAAKKLLAQNGMMLYTTCTISLEENQENIKRLLGMDRALDIMDLRDFDPIIPNQMVDPFGFGRMIPHVQRTDGFFYALIKNRERSSYDQDCAILTCRKLFEA
jgi:16S rRNA (cytosine967-C5)-methyltransferase